MSSALRVFSVTLCALAALILICGVLLTAALFSADVRSPAAPAFSAVPFSPNERT